MDNLILAARLHSMGGAREDIRKAIESWNLEKRNPNVVPDMRQEIEGDPNRKGADVKQSQTPAMDQVMSEMSGAKGGAQIGGKTAFTDDMRARDKSAAATADATRDQRNADQSASATRLKNQEMQPRHDANLAEVDRITGGGDAQGNVNASSKGVDNPAQSIKDRFDRREAGNPSMGDKMKQGFGNVKEAVGNVGARVGAAGSKALSSAGEAIGNAATAAKDKMGQAGQAVDAGIMGAARGMGQGVGTAQAKGSQMLDSAKAKGSEMGAKASEMGGGMLDAAKRMGQGRIW